MNPEGSISLSGGSVLSGGFQTIGVVSGAMIGGVQGVDSSGPASDTPVPSGAAIGVSRTR